MYRQESDNLQTFLTGEGQLLELISEGAPLPEVLDRVCTALDVQVGNVVSLVLFADDAEHALHTIEQSALKFGLTAFSCTPILSPSGELFGTLEIYCCVPRKPTLSESGLIERAAHFAAVAIQHYNHDVQAESCSLNWDGATRGSPHEWPPSSN
ncbi:MAG TPA: GAF domain-containing protein [Candidatus Limnocylindrales bacterium]|nr:GAF domain-containing protein [Candidatus Limnocylindrales bacterium]